MIKKVVAYITNLWYIVFDSRGDNIMGVNILDVAKYLICMCNKNGDEITQLRLQKLLYFIEAYYMVSFDKNYLYNEDFYAWTYGPVCKEVYDKYKGFMDSPIIEENCDSVVVFEEDVVNTIEEIYKVFGKLSTTKLIKLTHMKNSPWYNTSTNSKNTISKKETKVWFKENFC